MITTEGRYELERFLHIPCLPFRVTETREYRANYYSATVIGGWTSAAIEDEEGESRKLEDGFPAYADLNIDGVGQLPYQFAVYKEGTKKRHVPYGVFFLVNGQVHGSLPSDFVTRRLKLDYLSGQYGPLLVSVDCTPMDERVREDFFMASRDRIRKNEVYSSIENKLTDALRSHPGLQELNQQRRKQILESHLAEKAPLEALQKLLDLDPTLSSLFSAGDRLASSTGPVQKSPFIGRKFPTFFRLSNEPEGGLVKPCPLNRTCRVEFETDAVNDYFRRAIEPGKILVDPPVLMEHSHLWNGRFETRFRVPWDAQLGDLIKVTVTVTDIERDSLSLQYKSTFMLKAIPEANDNVKPGPRVLPAGPRPDGTNRRTALALPNIKEVRKDEWEAYHFDKYSALQLKHDGEGGYDCYVNIDNSFLLTELASAKVDDKPLVKFWFTYGLVLAALGMIRHQKRLDEIEGVSRGDRRSGTMEEDSVDLESISHYCNGLAQVIVPIIRTLNRGPVFVGG